MKKLSLSLFKNTGSLKFVAVFVLALVLRALPEFLGGKYPVGFDALGGYVPAVLALPDVSPMRLFGWVYSPLAIYLLWFVRAVTCVDVYLLLKVVGPVFFGLFGVSFCYLLSRGLGWGDKKSFFVSVFLLLQPAVMRMGWDQLREELGLMFLFVLLAVTKMDLVKGARCKPFLFVVLSVLIVFSHQLAAILFFVVVIFQLFGVMIKRRKEFWYGLVAVVPAACFFVWQFYMTYFVELEFSSHFMPLHLPGGTGLFVFKNYFLSDPRFLGGDYWSVLGYVGCLSLYVFVPLIPLAVKGFFRDRVFTPMLVWLCVTSFSIVVFPWFAFAEYWWWILLLPIPLTVFAGEGLDRLRAFSDVKQFRKAVIGIALLGVVAFGYAASVIPIGYPYAYYYMPSGLVESSVPLEDIPDIKNAMQWANEHIPDGSTVIVPEKLQGLAFMELRQDIKIRVAPALMALSEVIEVNREKIEAPCFAIYNTIDAANYNQSELIIYGNWGVFSVVIQ